MLELAAAPAVAAAAAADAAAEAAAEAEAEVGPEEVEVWGVKAEVKGVEVEGAGGLKVCVVCVCDCMGDWMGAGDRGLSAL